MSKLTKQTVLASFISLGISFTGFFVSYFYTVHSEVRGNNPFYPTNDTNGLFFGYPISFAVGVGYLFYRLYKINKYENIILALFAVISLDIIFAYSLLILSYVPLY